jgi:hypothetical protein
MREDYRRWLPELAEAFALKFCKYQKFEDRRFAQVYFLRSKILSIVAKSVFALSTELTGVSCVKKCACSQNI